MNHSIICIPSPSPRDTLLHRLWLHNGGPSEGEFWIRNCTTIKGRAMLSIYIYTLWFKQPIRQKGKHQLIWLHFRRSCNVVHLLTQSVVYTFADRTCCVFLCFERNWRFKNEKRFPGEKRNEAVLISSFRAEVFLKKTLASQTLPHFFLANTVQLLLVNISALQQSHTRKVTRPSDYFQDWVTCMWSLKSICSKTSESWRWVCNSQSLGAYLSLCVF